MGGTRIVIAGGHGKIALLLERLLAERGDQAVGLIRNPAHVADVRKAAAKLSSATWRRPPSMMSRCCCPGLTRWCSRPALVFRAAAPAARTPSTAAKTAAETDLRARDLDWTILRPGGLTDAPATGKIRLAAPPVPRGTVPRADVAAVTAALLDEPGTRHQILELTGGDSPVATAVHNIS